MNTGWNPVVIQRFIRGFPTSAKTALVETKSGLGYLKAMGGPEGPHTLAAEVIAIELARWFGLSTFDWAIIEVDEVDEIPFLDREGNQTGVATPGPAFITRSERGMVWSGNPADLKLVANLLDVSRLVLFDTWLLNCDRHSYRLDMPLENARINRDNVFLSEEMAPPGKFVLKAMDHTHCFSCGREWTDRLSQIENVRDKRVFGLFPEFRPFLDREAVEQAANRLREIDSQTVAEFTLYVPSAWEVSPRAMEALIHFVVQRARYVADTIEEKLWPQASLFEEDASGDTKS